MNKATCGDGCECERCFDLEAARQIDREEAEEFTRVAYWNWWLFEHGEPLIEPGMV